MGTIYSQYVLGIPEPKVGLLNIGEEGQWFSQCAPTRCCKNPRVSLIGNAEGRDVLPVASMSSFVMVVGNVLLKFAEAVGESATNPREELPKDCMVS